MPVLLLIMLVLFEPLAMAMSFHYQSIHNSTLELIILHNNDMHARFEQTDKYTGKCLQEDSQVNNCYGGFARVSTVVKKYRKEAENGGPALLYLNAGDTYIGTPWFSVFKDKVSSDFMNILKPDAMSLGNHEFDLGVETLLPFLNDVNFPVLAANINNTADHPLWQTRALKKSIVLELKGFKIGIIGYLTPETKSISNTGDVEIISEISSINEEAKTMEKDGVNIIIALGHSGYEMDKEIAKNCPLVDVVIGGHSHTFLYTGESPSVEKVEGPYPTVIVQQNGKRIPVVQAYAFSKYLGELKLMFDEDGHLIEYGGQPILLNGTIAQDPDVLALEDVYRSKMDQTTDNVVGVTKVHLDGSNCRFTECNLGNMITDAFVYTRIKQYEGSHMTDASIAIIGSGDIRASIKMGTIRQFDLGTILPFDNELVAINITGLLLRQMFEQSVQRYSKSVGRGEFVQTSGVRVVYDMTREAGNRVVSVLVLCGYCKVPFYDELKHDREYGIIMTSYLHGGGDGYFMFKDLIPLHMNVTVKQAVQEYIQNSRLMYPSIDGRITVYN